MFGKIAVAVDEPVLAGRYGLPDPTRCPRALGTRDEWADRCLCLPVSRQSRSRLRQPKPRASFLVFRAPKICRARRNAGGHGRRKRSRCGVARRPSHDSSVARAGGCMPVCRRAKVKRRGRTDVRGVKRNPAEGGARDRGHPCPHAGDPHGCRRAGRGALPGRQASRPHVSTLRAPGSGGQRSRFISGDAPAANVRAGCPRSRAPPSAGLACASRARVSMLRGPGGGGGASPRRRRAWRKRAGRMPAVPGPAFGGVGVCVSPARP